ncbi:D-arabinose 1-dehydrogenase, Zn-dependent alcohol dehydrogenase family [Streptomyces sp. WMMB 714]|nr:D-arabinose 1-dehydrogenase, Zn-dependent alcohol dehydrogenase family [Streptomyces sp. WMMB 714]
MRRASRGGPWPVGAVAPCGAGQIGRTGRAAGGGGTGPVTPPVLCPRAPGTLRAPPCGLPYCPAVKALLYDEFGQLPALRDVPDPAPAPGGAVVEVAATGLCRSDWHAWQGHDSGVRLPHVGGHELAGTVAAVGAGVRESWVGRRVTVPFVCGCGACAECVTGNQQVCERQTQPGFTHWGSFAQYVAVDHAENNLVPLPGFVDTATAASLGCRFGTAFRATLRQGRAAAGEFVAVWGCGGAGLSAVMIAASCGARVVAVDVSPPALELARESGAEAVVDASAVDDPAAAVAELTGGGAHLSLDCLGRPETCTASVRSLRRRGRHVQVGLLPPEQAAVGIPMDRVVAWELEVLGSHGVQAHEYPALLGLLESGAVRPDRLLRRRIGLSDAAEALAGMGSPGSGGTAGVTVIVP